MKLVLLSVFLFWIGSASLYTKEATSDFRTQFSKNLENQLQRVAAVKENAGMGRLGFMRFYFPTNEVRPTAGFLQRLKNCDDDTLIRAQAIYLFNMYVSTAAYKVDVPERLTVDYVGVLDGFHQCANGFPVTDAVSFYQKHQKEIQTLLKQFFAVRKLVVYEISNANNQRREKAFLTLLATSFAIEGKYPVYWATDASHLTGTPHIAETNLLKNLLHRALKTGNNKFIFFEQREVFGPELDSPLARQKAQTHTICRGANEECAACSYLFGREMCAEIAAKHRQWGLLRIYRITAKPMKGILRAADQTDRFMLANGKQSIPWDYHTATLVIMNLDGKYTPYVVDKFLAGDNPLAPNAWFKKFSLEETFFLITPFERMHEMEERFYRKDNKGRDIRAF